MGRSSRLQPRHLHLHWTVPAQHQFENYEAFYRFYLTQHSDPRNRALHAAGTALGLATAAYFLTTHRPWRALLGLPVAYALAWTGHFLVERNKPATFGHPLWSFVSDYRMLFGMLRNRLEKRGGNSD